ncbi:ATP-binding cassette domain-containing protein [Pseudooceanicola sp. 216_PA32_1]|uniref:ATP-binding cassette domain-containing protein n=1 Tax=Pseudooceanicola pacificus TaxID=2676438 RepID=A0A844WEV9_9RHOB|nr:ATP-binding cassette domain-containing protein [Pseudooceanicola pacificus]MWB78680.1 ATP-binding cassette domain-containing protein [Pseudooceanicola pacificus]
MTPAPSLHLHGSAAFAGTPLFHALALEVPAGRWTCLLGPSGIGKSTILRLFAGLAEGVRFTGRMGADDGAPLAGRVALMAQDDLLLPWLSVAGNVTLGARLRGETPDPARLARVLAQVGLDTLAARHPAALSGGQRQRAALARTLMEDRAVVLLDEPFSALDARTRARMQELTAASLAGRTVLLVTHDPGEAARLGHRILVMTETGLHDLPPPPGPVPRPAGDPQTLTLQARLLDILRTDDTCAPPIC